MTGTTTALEDELLDLEDAGEDEVVVGVVYVRAIMFPSTQRRISVRCIYCSRDHYHPWPYEDGEGDPGLIESGCKRGRYLVRLRRGQWVPRRGQQAGEPAMWKANGTPNKPQPKPQPSVSDMAAAIVDMLPPELADYARGLAAASGRPLDECCVLLVQSLTSMTADGRLDPDHEALIHELLVDGGEGDGGS
jgi:hypothetical protein